MSLAFYMDVHVPRAVATALRLRGIAVITAQDDAALLERATELGRILVSQDADLLREGRRLLAEQRGLAGIVTRTSFGSQAARL